jgi:hypothetical protein
VVLVLLYPCSDKPVDISLCGRKWNVRSPYQAKCRVKVRNEVCLPIYKELT